MKSEKSMVHYTIKVEGKVQGVFYRASTKETAGKLGITGWARNEPDGSVHIEAEGPPEKMKAFVAWCRQGPPFARVENVRWEEKPLEDFQDFSVRR